MEKARQNAEADKESLLSTSTSIEEEDNLTCPEEDFDKYSDEEFDPPAGQKDAFNSTLIDDKEDQMPFEYRHKVARALFGRILHLSAQT